jgi:stalled ribosome alternative rescue factor ArfA
MKNVTAYNGNAVAKDVRTPKYRMRVEKSKKAYTRKGRKPRGEF